MISIQERIDQIAMEIDLLSNSTAKQQLTFRKTHLIHQCISMSIATGILSQYTAFVSVFKKLENISDRKFDRIFLKFQNSYFEFDIDKEEKNKLQKLQCMIEEKIHMEIVNQKLTTINEFCHDSVSSYLCFNDCSKLNLSYEPNRIIPIVIQHNGENYPILIDKLDDVRFVRHTILCSKPSKPPPNSLTDGTNAIFLNESILKLDIGSPLQLITNPNDPHKEIYVKTDAGSRISFIVTPFDRVEYLKMEISNQLGIPIDQQRPILAGKQLEDGNTLGDYNIEDGNLVHLLLRLRGGGISYENNMIQPQEPDFSVTQLLKYHSFEGYWFNLAKIQSFIPKSEKIKLPSNIGTGDEKLADRILSTLLAIALLRKLAVEQRDAWQLIEKKALEWLTRISKAVNWEKCISDIISQI